MSADLFAEFGVNTNSSQPANSTSQRPARHQSSSLVPDLDFFGETSSTSFSNQASQSAAAGTQWQSSSWDKSFASGPVQHDSGNDVLFDATLETAYDESDDWGEFETADVPPQRAPVEEPKSISTLSAVRPVKVQEPFNLLDSPSIQSVPSVSAKQTVAIRQQGNAQKIRKEPPRLTPSLSTEDDPFEDWGDFVDGPATAQSQAPDRKAPASRTQHGSALSRTNPLHTTTSATNSGLKFAVPSSTTTADQVRPTNIPPPSVLLELFPQVLEQLRHEATEARKNMQHRDKVERAAWSIQITLRTAARVVAGRTLRWKRDKILSQSMRIGPAGKPGGMKLSTVNKNEDVKEQQQAVDVLTMWRDRAALFNSIIQASGNRTVPIIQENVRAMTLGADRGALKASHACALCGLKRDERLPKLDENVEDSFGEWWTEHWGHTDCRQFWENNKTLLGQR
ncbi:uncharacterized protein BO95DRAFT_422782 [Aspergillus brunneoviolaceus CBS 621.78]|uniref:Uncharacterized protein n=1 Tax=Aspergillus brunneoviolaceus CBS 621.78 TaxID=1450534 RepID=A0ACD1FWV9_9EURO|nr:hypothetical protein BO95DRAFT_422782 [Aspergillus brunneoviolaceus CBS 621.78]RAH41452.1 hypothetical protein BO95DRAFT_422782 [Aspergillus brunneoviolaceus CBS 621.78]